jgi:beta-phosphoglucomutase-like phosphatase (HAD superfamily)
MATVGPLNFPESGFAGIIFDCDGTLVDSMPSHFEAWCEALARFGAANILQEDVFYAMGGRPSMDIVAEINAEYGLRLNADEVAWAKREAFLKRLCSLEPIEEVVDFARRWRGRVPMAVATGGGRVVIEKTLQCVGISDLFDEVVAAEDVVNGKPAPDIYLAAAARLGVTPIHCLALEDAPAGIMAAQAAGMKVLRVPAPLSFARR